MESPERGALMLVRFIAVALIGWAVADAALYVAICQHNHQSAAIGKLILKTVPLLAGIIMLIKAQPIAEWISDRLDF